MLQENKFMLPARFEQVTIWLVVIDNSKPMRSAVCSGKERGLITRTAADNWGYSGIRRTETPYWSRHTTQIRLVMKREKFAWTN